MANTTLLITNNSRAIPIVAIITIVITATGIADTSKLVYAQSEKGPNFNLKTLDGSQVSLNSFKGKPTVL